VNKFEWVKGKAGEWNCHYKDLHIIRGGCYWVIVREGQGEEVGTGIAGNPEQARYLAELLAKEIAGHQGD